MDADVGQVGKTGDETSRLVIGSFSRSTRVTPRDDIATDRCSQKSWPVGCRRSWGRADSKR